MLITDPPYNVDYHGAAGSIMNDAMPETGFLHFLSAAFKAADGSLVPGGAFYVWHAASEIRNFYSAAVLTGWTIRQQIVWVKNSFVLGRQDYHWQHEPCFYGWKDGASHYFTACRTKSTVIESKADIKKMTKGEMTKMLQEILGADEPTDVLRYDKPSSSKLHPTMKPVEMFARLIKNSSRPGDIVLDLFGGSGTTMIACEKTGRVCRMVELDPHYCDVIRRRWAEFVHGEGCDWQSLTPTT